MVVIVYTANTLRIDASPTKLRCNTKCTFPKQKNSIGE